MKSLVSKVILSFFFLFPKMDITDDIITAIKQGRATELVKTFEEKVSIKIIDQEDVLSKPQAEANLKYFFEKHPVKNLSSLHLNSMSNSTQYLTGSLETVNGKYKVSALIRRGSVSQFRIEIDND